MGEKMSEINTLLLSEINTLLYVRWWQALFGSQAEILPVAEGTK